ncbi:MAG TPA: helix-turn-helix transcriptional regulator [Patescibacteria group bacterium]
MSDVDAADQQTVLEVLQGPTELGLRIKQARHNAQMSQEELGKFIGVSDKSISAYEQGRSTPPIHKLKKIAEYTIHPLSYFTLEENLDALIGRKLTKIEEDLAEVKAILLAKKRYS